MAYDFSTLNDKDLEELVRDVLSIKLNLNFQSFKSGQDGGIDLRYASTNNENEIIVQVKHFLDSGLVKLKSYLKKKEAPKVKSINPKRYIFVTSLPLSVRNKEEIKTIFNPFILSTSDILGKEDLNSFLRNNPRVVENHFKLWLSGTAVLKRILHNGTHGRSEFYGQKIKDQIKIFVPNKTHSRAVDLLNKNYFILITGAPGIGKTTLADILTYQLLAEDFELVYVREIREAETMHIPDRKQVFYFDDFLGSITLDLKSSRNADSAIVNFIDRIKSDKQKRLILTCRTTILNQAKEESEKIETSKIELSNHEVKIQDYGNIDKARILYNHIYFSNLSEELKETFFKDQFYWKVIKHRFYNPRVIKFFTDIDSLEANIAYEAEVIYFLDNPSKIWQKSYTNQISENARLFLATMYSIGGKYVIEEKKFKEAFDARLQFEAENNNYSKQPGVFNKVVKELIGGFINKILKTEKNITTVEYRFLNPSIEDFLYYYYSSNIDEYFSILKSAIFFDQFKERISTSPKNGKRIDFSERDNYKKLHKIFKDRLPHLNGSGSYKEMDTVVTLIRLFEWEDIKDDVIEIMNNFSTIYLGWDERENLIEFLDYIAEKNLINEFSFSIKDMLLLLSDHINYYFQIDSFSRLIAKQAVYCQLLVDSQKEDPEYYEKIQINIDKSWNNSMQYFIERTTNFDNITDKEELVNIINKRKEEAKKMNETLNLKTSPIIDSFSFDYDMQIKKNLETNALVVTEIKTLNVDDDTQNEVIKINNLFNSGSDKEWDGLPF